MKKAVVVSALLLGLIGKAQAGYFDWVPSPKDILNGVADTFENVWDGAQNFVIDPLINLGSDGVNYVSDKVIGVLGLSPDISAKIQQVVDANIKYPYDIRVVPADASDASWGLIVVTDPYAHKVFFKDDVHLESINVPGKGNRNIPAMGFFAEDGHGHSLGDPRGLATDGDRNFWIADATLGCLWNLYYDPVTKSMKYGGSMTGFEAPFGVAYSRGRQAGSGDDVVYVTNSGSNSICRVPRTLGVDQPLRTAASYFCSDNFGGSILVNPRAIVTEDNNAVGAEGSPTILYVSYDGNKIARIQDLGTSFSITASTTVETKTTVKFTGLATDLSGNLYAIDNLGGRVFYFKTSPGAIEEVYAFGQSGTGSTSASVKFNAPRGIAIAGTDLYVVEDWTANSGLQKFKAVPTIDKASTFVQVSVDFPGNLEFWARLSTKGRVSVELALYENLSTMAPPTVVWAKSPTDIPILSGGGRGRQGFPMIGNIGSYNGVALPPNQLYRMTVKSYKVDDLSTPVDVYVNDMVLTAPGQQQPYAIQMKETATTEPDISKPQIIVENHSTIPLQGFTVRLWMNREEMPSQNIIVDSYYTNPTPIAVSVGTHPRNPNLVFADFKYPPSFSLNPGQSTSDQGFQVGIHYQNYYPGQWNRNNDFSWSNITANYATTRNVTLISSSGSILYGTWPDVPDALAAPVAPSNHNPVLGFENVANWSAPQAQLSSNTIAFTEGLASLSIQGSGWFPVKSTAMATSSISGVTSHLAADVFVPGSQPNPWWLGSIDLVANCPSANLYNAYVGHVELTPLPQNQFSTVAFTVPQNVLTALQGNFNDFSLEFDVNVNAGAPPLLLDYLRFVP